MATSADHARLAELERAVDRLSHMAATHPISEGERRQIEAVRDWLSTYAVAARHLAGAGVATPRLVALIERGCHEARTAFSRADDERARQGHLSATG